MPALQTAFDSGSGNSIDRPSSPSRRTHQMPSDIREKRLMAKQARAAVTASATGSHATLRLTIKQRISEQVGVDPIPPHPPASSSQSPAHSDDRSMSSVLRIRLDRTLCRHRGMGTHNVPIERTAVATVVRAQARYDRCIVGGARLDPLSKVVGVLCLRLPRVR